MTDDANLDLLLRYLSGEATPEEARAIAARLEHDPEFRAQVEAWRRVREARPPAWETEGALSALQRELRQGKRRPAVRLVQFAMREVPAKKPASFSPARIAAMLVIGAGLAAVWGIQRTRGTEGEAVAPVALQEYATPRGRRATFHLPDGTQVMLAAETRLLVPSDFGRRGARREVQLEGQAHFNVVHDETRPFVVRTATSVTEDIGTVFAVRAYPTEPAVEVVVAEGAVAVQPAHRSAFQGMPRRVLGPGELARLQPDGELRVQDRVDLARYLGWTKGILTFDRLPFRQAAAEVERWYGLEIRLADAALGARRISGTFDGESSDAVLGYLALVLNARYEWQGRVATFFPQHTE